MTHGIQAPPPVPAPLPRPSLLSRLLGHPSHRPAIIFAGGAPAISYGELTRRSAEIAVRLLDGRATLAGARVALLLPPGQAFVAALFGIWRAGGVAVPLSAVQTPPELSHILATAAPEITVLDAGVAGHLDALSAAAVSAEDRAGRSSAFGTSALTGRRCDITNWWAYGDGDGGGSGGSDSSTVPLAPPSGGGGDLPALMLFTSGTTGKPKGVLLSHAGVAATLSSLAEAWRWNIEDRLLHALPLYHTHGLIVALLGALWTGASVRFVAFDAAATWDAFEDVSVFMAVPTMYVRLMEAFVAAPQTQQARWTKAARGLRLFTSGSAALPAALHRSFAAATGQTILERYGMTEIGMALGNPYDGPRLPGSVGVPLPGVDAEIVDDEERPVAADQPGELRVRSPQLFLGYHGDAAATAAAYDAAGRFRTGDTANRGADGFIRLLGRTSVDILKSGGFKLSALEIEEVLRGHPGVAEVAVIGVPDAVWGDCVTACVVPRAGAGTDFPTLEGLRAYARDALAPYKLPRALRVLDQLPRNGMGKVQKALLK